MTTCLLLFFLEQGGFVSGYKEQHIRLFEKPSQCIQRASDGVWALETSDVSFSPYRQGSVPTAYLIPTSVQRRMYAVLGWESHGAE